jgi:gluconate 2-dehydrogenase gamma chain
MQRRQFLTLSANSLGGVLVYSLDRKSSLLTGPGKRLRIPLRFFSELEARTVASAAARIFPSDDSGPGAAEAGVTIYIDRQLAGPYGQDRFRYTQGPFEKAAAELGYQGKATPREIYREGLNDLKGFDKLQSVDQDKHLEQMESSLFFTLLRQHTIEGMFSDPIHGGNADMVGWQLVGFPGPRMSNYDEIDKYFGEAFRPTPVSLREMTGINVPPGEDQK